jgi:hypothetical protein
MAENTISNGTSGSSGTSGKSTLKTQKKQIKSVECKACKSFSYDEVELRNRVKALSATDNEYISNANVLILFCKPGDDNGRRNI